MSHFTEMKTSIRDIEALQKAVDAMGLELIKDGTARGYSNNTLKADYVIRLKGPYDIALSKQEDGTYDLIADWFNGHVEKEVGKKAGILLQNYAVAVTINVAKERGLHIEPQRLEDGTVRMILREKIHMKG